MKLIDWIGVMFCIFVYLINYVNSCGVSTHIDIAYRAMAFFNYTASNTDYRQILEDHTDAFQGSTSFADSFYNDLCFNGDFHYVSEDTHWTPFVNVSVNYIRDNYPQPWDEATEKLAAFLFGVMSHQVSDVLWHALDVDQAFLATMGSVNFHDSYEDAHDVGDFGGDVMNRYDLDLSFIKKIFYWYIPTDDLVNIYQMYYGDDRVTADMIISCSNWMYLARLGEQLGVIEALFPENADVSPFLIERLQDFFLGGMDDMSLWIADRWHVTADLIEHGSDFCDLTENPVYITCDEYLMHRTAISSQWLNQKKKSLDLPTKSSSNSRYTGTASKVTTKLSQNDIIQKRKDRGVTLEIGSELQDLFGELIAKNRAPYPTTTQNDTNMIQSMATYTTGMEYSRLGESLLFGDVNSDGYNDLIIGAPGYSISNGYQNGRVYIICGTSEGFSNDSLLVEDSSDVTIEAPDANGRFGMSTAIVDLNADGRNDLVVSAPYVGVLDLTYQGKVYIYYGKQDGTISLNPQTTISCTEIYCNFGLTLTSGYLDSDEYMDLLVGSPYAPSGGEQRGFVTTFLARPFTDEIPNMTESDADWRYEGEQDYSWFGWSVNVGSSRLAVGAPNHRICAEENCDFNEDDIQAVGKVYVFDLPLTEDPISTVTGETELEQLGFDNVIIGENDDNILLVSAPTAAGESISDHPGVVKMYSLSNTNTTLGQLDGDRKYSRFGASISKVDVDDAEEFIVGAPRWRDNDDLHLGGGGPGRAFIYRMNANAQTELMYTLFSEEFKSQFGYTVTSSKYSSKTIAAIGAPFSNKESRLGGSVETFFL